MNNFNSEGRRMGKQYADTTTRERAKQNMFSYWFPRVQGHGIDTPKSLVFQLPRSEDGSEIDQELYKAFFMEDGEKDIETIQKWLDTDVIPVLLENKMQGRLFVKNGTFSNKFWAEGSCIVEGIGNLASAVANVNYGALCGNASGLGELVVRQFIWRDRRKTPCIYNGLPLRPEFRVFYDFNDRQVIFTINYWDSGYVEPELHDLTDRLVFQNEKKKLECFYVKHKDEVAELVEAAMTDVDLDGAWSVDIMWDAIQGKYWLIDMAVAETSAYWDRRPGVEQKPEQRTHKPNASGVGEDSIAPCVLLSGPKTSTEGGDDAGPIIFDRYAGLRYGRRETENRFSFWFNKINKPTTVETGLDIPKTLIVRVPLDVICAFGDCAKESMKVIEAWFRTEVRLAVKEAGLDRRMLFIKNASFSNKFYGNQSCLATSATLMPNFINIQQAAAGVFVGYDGLDELIIRERIMYDSATTACIYHGLPLRPEYRVFYDFDLHEPIFIANYWDKDYVGGHLSDATDKVVFHKRAPYIKSEYEEHKYMVLNMVAAAMDHVTELSGPWSIDVMQTGDRFYIIDMAVAEESAYWEFRPGVARGGEIMNATYVKADTLITTDRGDKPIAEIYPGEHVLTRTGELRRVAEVLTKRVELICWAMAAKGIALGTTTDGGVLAAPWYNDNPERHTWKQLDKFLPRKSSFVRFNRKVFLGMPGSKSLPLKNPETELYSLAVRDADSFVANGFVVRAQQVVASPAEILNFIRNFKGAEEPFLTGCCYWFALILQERFGGQMLYFQSPGHFVQKIDGRLYDITGDVTESFANEHLPIVWVDSRTADSSWYRCVLRDCVDKRVEPSY